MNIWPSGSQHKTPHAPKCHYLFRKFIGLLIIDHLIKGKLVRWGDECLFTSGPLVSGWFGERDREASMRRDPRHRTKSGFIQIRQIGAHLMGPLWTSWEPDWPQATAVWVSLFSLISFSVWVSEGQKRRFDGQESGGLSVITFDGAQTAINDLFI